MRIKFTGSDPRAGTVAQMDSRRGQELIDAGSAEQVSDNDADNAAQQTAPVDQQPQQPATSSTSAEQPAEPEHKAAKPATKGAKA